MDRFLIVDDDRASADFLEEVLAEWGWVNVVSTTEPQEARSLFISFAPDIILLDLMMPDLDGFGVLEQLRPLIAARAYLPILVLVSDATTQTSKRRALAAGATDFLSKPVDPVELPLRVRNLLKTRKLELGLAAQASLLETQVRERTRELATQAAMLEARVQKRSREIDRAQFDALACLAVAAEFRDDTTGQHTLRVGQMAARLARRLDLDGIQVETLRQTAPLHDVGKIGAPDHILLKPAALSAEEWKAMQQHTVIGSRILARHRSPLFKMAAQIALTHHERWDGSGYPRGLAGEAIPLEGRIVALADVFDALTHDRPYKQAWSLSRALAEIEQQAGHQFDPALVTAFLSLDGY